MATPTFDTLKFVKELESAGVPAVQAAAYVRALVTALDSTLAAKADVASVKDDIALVKTELKADIADLRRYIQAMELRLTIKLGAFLVAAAGVFGAIIKLL